jgi:hypothetical protein
LSRWRLNGRVEKRSETLKPMDRKILSAICLVLVIIRVIERPASAKSKFQNKRGGALAV